MKTNHTTHWALQDLAEQGVKAESINLWARVEQAALRKQRVRGFAQRFSAVGIALVLLMALAFVVSPDVRAQVENWVGIIGGTRFTTTDQYPGGDVEATIVPELEMSLADAQETLPFNIDLPTWVPEGYVLNDTVRLPQFEDGVRRVSLTWSAAEKGYLSIDIADLPADQSNWLIAPESAVEVLVNGEPAALVRGGWYWNEKRWDDSMGILTLFLSHNEQTYRISSFEKHVPVEALIQIAESLP